LELATTHPANIKGKEAIFRLSTPVLPKAGTTPYYIVLGVRVSTKDIRVFASRQ
jgi:hypothetical protein